MQQKNYIQTNKKITYVIEELLGSGTGGYVYRAYNDTNLRKEYVALKVQNFLDQSEKQTLETLKGKKLNHVVNVLDLDSYNNQIIIIMDLANGSFHEFWRNSNIQDVQEILHYFLQIVIGTQELHSLSLIHRDLKLENVVYMEVNNKMHLKLCDTGLMRQKDGRKTVRVGTPYYMPPEQINQFIYDEKVDIWALGMLLYEMLAKTPMVNGNSIEDLLQKIINIKQAYINSQIDFLPIPNQEYSQEIKILLKQMINITSSQRIKAEVIVQKLKLILKINNSQQNNDNQSPNSQIDSTIKEQIRLEIQKELEQKQKEEFEKLKEQQTQELEQQKVDIMESYQKQMRDEILKIQKECEEQLRIKFELDLKNNEQKLQQQHNQQLIELNEKQQEELKNNQAIEMQNLRKQMEYEYQQNLEKQITQKEQIIQKNMEDQIQMQLKNKEQFLKIQLQEQLQKYYQQEFEQKSRDFAKFQNLMLNIQQNIIKNKMLIEEQLKQLQQQQQQQRNPSIKYLKYNQTFQTQLQNKLNQLQLLSQQLPQVNINFNQQQTKYCNQVDENLKKLTQIINSQQDILNVENIENFIKDINNQLKQIKDDQQKQSIEQEQQEYMGIQIDSEDFIEKLQNSTQNLELKLQTLNIDFDLLLKKDNELFEQQQSVNKQFYQIQVEFKLLQESVEISKKVQTQLHEVKKINKQLSNLMDKLSRFEQILQFCMNQISEQREQDLQLIIQNLNVFIQNINIWEQKIDYYNQKEIDNEQKEEQEMLQELNRQLQTSIQIRNKLILLIEQLKSDKNQNLYKIFTSIEQEVNISIYTLQSADNTYENFLKKQQQQIIQKQLIYQKHQKITIDLIEQTDSLKKTLDNLENQNQRMQNMSKDEESLSNIMKELERNKTIILDDYQIRISQIVSQIDNFEKTIFTNIEEVKLAEIKITFQIDFISQQLTSEVNKLNNIEQQINELKNENIDQLSQSSEKNQEDLKSKLSNLQLNQINQSYNQIKNYKTQFQDYVDDYNKRLNEHIQKCNLSFQFIDLNQKLKNKAFNDQIQILQQKENSDKKLVQKQIERIQIIKKQVQEFNDQQMLEFISNYITDSQAITDQVESMQSHIQSQVQFVTKDQKNQFNKQIEKYLEQIKQLQKKKKNNSAYFDNLQFYERNLEVIKSFDLLFQLFFLIKREIVYYQQNQINNSQAQKLQRHQDELKNYNEIFQNIELCLNFYIQQNNQFQDQILLSSISKIVKILNDTIQKNKNDTNQKNKNDTILTNNNDTLKILNHTIQQNEIDLVMQLQESNKELKIKISLLQNNIESQNKVKLNAKIKQTNMNDQKKQFIKDLKQAFSHPIPKYSDINIKQLVSIKNQK
ncbi:unnamed protein product [Paramecium pentaurelia]|uniref:Protein kinase domain-containing protein n=1 Tax=Paramecium pentaurelia TaxID=43138 RepID=A0A8S1Y608_9CILI|nr:unnamed protein product [Paramecium pentaurelia]